jgi:2-polyprenyl-6-methoxyphenol hydroxylase-like FAD-dependent oxidoreductase
MVRFERRLANGFGKNRCWLAGDSAHLGGPVGVQSLNVGMAEAHDLSDAILRALRDGNGSDWLTAYNDRYTCEWKRLSGVAIPIEGAADVNPWIWQNRNRLLPCLPGHNSELTLLASRLGLRM